MRGNPSGYRALGRGIPKICYILRYSALPLAGRADFLAQFALHSAKCLAQKRRRALQNGTVGLGRI